MGLISVVSCVSQSLKKNSFYIYNTHILINFNRFYKRRTFANRFINTDQIINKRCFKLEDAGFIL